MAGWGTGRWVGVGGRGWMGGWIGGVWWVSVGENSIKNRSDILLLVFFRVHIFFSDTSCLRAITEMNKNNISTSCTYIQYAN